jgi:hypothetical protein
LSDLNIIRSAGSPNDYFKLPVSKISDIRNRHGMQVEAGACEENLIPPNYRFGDGSFGHGEL